MNGRREVGSLANAGVAVSHEMRFGVSYSDRLQSGRWPREPGGRQLMRPFGIQAMDRRTLVLVINAVSVRRRPYSSEILP